jgi:hypothetical protein
MKNLFNQGQTQMHTDKKQAERGSVTRSHAKIYFAVTRLRLTKPRSDIPVNPCPSAVENRK